MRTDARRRKRSYELTGNSAMRSCKETSKTERLPKTRALSSTTVLRAFFGGRKSMTITLESMKVRYSTLRWSKRENVLMLLSVGPGFEGLRLH